MKILLRFNSKLNESIHGHAASKTYTPIGRFCKRKLYYNDFTENPSKDWNIYQSDHQIWSFVFHNL